MFNPLFDRVLVRPAVAADVSKGGIHLPAGTAKKPCKGEVLNVGPGFPTEKGLQPMQVKIGDVVWYQQFSGTPVEADDGEMLLIISQGEILAVEEK